MRTKFLILTKSHKRRDDGINYGKCVAGIIRGADNSFRWVRLVADENGNSILDEDFPFEPLDIIEVDLRPCPLGNHVENCLYDCPEKVDTININQLKSIFRKMPHSFFGSMSSIFVGNPKNSLTIFLATDLYIYRDYAGRRRVDFKMGNNTANKISMTDPNHYRLPEERIPLAICVASLPHNPVYNKFIASIFPIDSYE
ncbi:dual OB domain-containing protein, partial [Ralstonia pseudosolanacearum]|uniref:dual OB domain-containing protein n=1 Tax=Ralstonia pseudosolanacearum TaxID=1310165 RepID=UPI003D185B93